MYTIMRVNTVTHKYSHGEMKNKKLIKRRNDITQGWQFCGLLYRLGKRKERGGGIWGLISAKIMLQIVLCRISNFSYNLAIRFFSKDNFRLNCLMFSSKVSSEELALRSLKASPLVKAFLTPGGIFVSVWKTGDHWNTKRVLREW